MLRGIIKVDEEFKKKIILVKKREIIENFHTNMNNLMRIHGFTQKKVFFDQLNQVSGVSKRKLRGWYNDGKLPNLNHVDITLVCSHLKIHLSDLVSNGIDKTHIQTRPLSSFIPGDIAKKNILEWMIKYDIGNGQKFESYFQGIYSSDYFNVLQRKKNHQRNISWSFIITAAYFFETSVGTFFINEEDK